MKIPKIHEIIPGKLYQSGKFLGLPLDIKLQELHKLNIQIVVNLWTTPDIDLQNRLLSHYYYKPMPDGFIKTTGHLLKIVQEVAQLINDGYVVLTHCYGGRNRSGLFNALLCMHLLRMNGKEAVEYIKKQRPNSLVNKSFVEFIINLKEVKQLEKMRKIIAIGGMPGTGKTSLMIEFMKGKDWQSCEPVKLVSSLYCKENDIYILGKYEEGEVFSGTDRLSMAVQPNTQEWLKGCHSNILFEGDRLFNQSFLRFIKTLPDTELKIIIIKVPKDILKERYKDRCSNQSEQFIKGRETKCLNIIGDPLLRNNCIELPNANLNDQKKIIVIINKILNNEIIEIIPIKKSGIFEFLKKQD